MFSRDLIKQLILTVRVLKGLLSEHGTIRTTSYTLQNFLNELPTSDSGDSALGFLAKGAILWELSTRIFHQLRGKALFNKPNRRRNDLDLAASGQTLTTHRDTFNRLDRLIDQVIASIESVSLGRKEYILPRCITNAAAIRLHSSLANTNTLSRGKCLLAAEAIVLSLNSIPDLDSAYTNPIIAVSSLNHPPSSHRCSSLFDLIFPVRLDSSLAGHLQRGRSMAFRR